MNWFLYDIGLRHERVNTITAIFILTKFIIEVYYLGHSNKTNTH